MFAVGCLVVALELDGGCSLVLLPSWFLVGVWCGWCVCCVSLSVLVCLYAHCLVVGLFAAVGVVRCLIAVVRFVC